MLHYPLRFKPFFRPMVWGGRNIARFLGKNLPPHLQPLSPGGAGVELLAYGESWEVSDHSVHQSVLATASWFGVTLRELMERHPRDLLGPADDRFAVFPWLIKLLDANDWLSVQVHPDEQSAARLCPTESAKTECWYVLSATPQSRIYGGLKPGVRPDAFRQALLQGTVTDCLHSFTPTAGDFVHLPAGTVHALGGGVFIAEIQQTSDATFRLFDWNRKDATGRARPLHIDQGMACIDWKQGPVAPVRIDDTANDHRQRLVACPYFEVDHLRANAAVALGGAGRLQALIVIAGRGRFDNGEYVLPGDAWVLPAAMPAITLRLDAPLSALLCTLPEA